MRLFLMSLRWWDDTDSASCGKCKANSGAAVGWRRVAGVTKQKEVAGQLRGEQVSSSPSSPSRDPFRQNLNRSQLPMPNVVCNVPQHHRAANWRVGLELIGNNSIPGRYAFSSFHKYVSVYLVLGTEDRTMNKTIIIFSPWVALYYIILYYIILYYIITL